MSELLAGVMQRAREWFTQAREAGWLEDDDLQLLQRVEQRTPADLFEDQQMRPLVVALFGGTGVGKSSLLNRVAGATIARVGQERPTSREVTVYVHEDVKLAELPGDLPLQAVQVKRHAIDAQRDVLWLDAPDIDSTEEENRRCALAWLPHVDLVCYVVSPERYRDDAGWRVLAEREYQHGWIFVFNHWDEGDPQQVDDFAGMLRGAGFEEPLVVRTCCATGRSTPSPDEFDRLLKSLRDLLNAHGVRELTRLGHRARLAGLREALQGVAGRLGDEQGWQRLLGQQRELWGGTVGTICDGMEWTLRDTARQIAGEQANIWQRVRQGMQMAQGRGPLDEKNESSFGAQLDRLVAGVWDDWPVTKLSATQDTLEVGLSHAGLAPAELRSRLDEVVQSAGEKVGRELAEAIRVALARPGGWLTRLVRRVTGFLTTFLPVVALFWVALAVVRSYYAAAGGSAPFMGTEFAIHSVLLVAVAWAVPLTIDRLLRPSIERIALQALRRGLKAGLDEVGVQLAQVLRDRAAAAQAVRERHVALIREISGLLVRPLDVHDPAVGRVISSASPGKRHQRSVAK